MRKWIALTLALVLVLSLCACQGGENTDSKKTPELRVGFGRANITPNYPVPLAGYGNTTKRMSNGFIDYLMATCIAITDENDTTVLMITLDNIGSKTSFLADMRKSITDATGVPAEHIMVTATHTHSAPDMDSSHASIAKYKPELIANTTQAAKEAMDDRSVATMSTGLGKTENLNFVRHYTTANGNIHGDNLTMEKGDSITGHTSDADNEIQVISFQREGKKDILAVNWQAHPKLNSTAETAEGKLGRPMISADYVGTCRDYVEANSDYLFAFYLGAAGNLNPNSKIASENVTVDCKVYGQKLGQHVLDATKELKATEGTTIKTTQKTFEAKIDKTENHLVLEATSVYSVWTNTNDSSIAMAEGKSGEIKSVYHAGSILNRSRIKEDSRTMEFDAFVVGNVGFCTAPYEMFDVSAMFVKDGSPFETTFVMSCANGSNGYFAAEYAFGKGGTYEVHNRTFAQGTAEAAANLHLEMLKSLK